MRVISAWIKEYLPHLVILVVAIIVVMFVIQTQNASRYYNKYLVSEGEFQAKNTAYLKLKEETDREKIILAKKRDEEAVAREERDREINRIRAAGRKKDAELVKAKAKIQELTPDQLTIELNARVPGQYTLLGTEDFSLSRRGGELTLSLFMDGERCAEALSERDSEIEKLKKNETSFNADRESFKVDLKATEDDLKRCDEARLSAITSKENIERAFKAMKWKQLGKGAVGGGVLVVVILKLTGVI